MTLVRISPEPLLFLPDDTDYMDGDGTGSRRERRAERRTTKNTNHTKGRKHGGRTKGETIAQGFKAFMDVTVWKGIDREIRELREKGQ